MENLELKVVITGAAGHIASAFYPLLGSGQVFGPRIKLSLNLLELPDKLLELEGIKMQLEDCAFELVNSINVHSDPNQAFKDIDVGIFLGGFPRKPGMERSDLLQMNNEIFKKQGEILNNVAKPSAKILVVANPSNTNCLTLSEHCPNIPKKNFTSLMQLDHNRCISLLARKSNVPLDAVRKVIIWGNHSLTQFPDVSQCQINGQPISDAIQDENYLQTDFVSQVQKRGGSILQVSKGTSFISGAIAVKDHISNWFNGTKEGDWTSFGVLTDGKAYGLPEGYCFSMPVVCKNFDYQIVDNLQLQDFSKEKILKTLEELKREKEEASFD